MTRVSNDLRTRAVRAALAVVSLLCVLAAAHPARAILQPWGTAPGLGPNQVVYTVDVICTTPGLVCAELDAYVDQQTAEFSGGGLIDIDFAAGTVQFLQGGTVDLMDGQGPRATYAAGAASDLVFAEIPFVGIPATEAGAVFALTNPPLGAGEPLLPGNSYPVTAVVSYSAIADIVGPVDAYLPELLLPPSDVTLTGTLELQAVIGSVVLYQLRDLTGSLTVQNPTTLGGEDVIVSVTADLTLNLQGAQGNPQPSLAPGLGLTGVVILVVALGGIGGTFVRRASEDRS